MKNRKLISLLCVSALIFTACSAKETVSSVTGKVTQISGSAVTLALGELTESDSRNGDSGNAPADGQTPPAKPDGDSDSAPADGQTPPAMPDGDSDSAPADGQTPPAMPDGDSDNAPADGQTPPAMPGNESGQTFNENGSTVTLDFSSAEITKDSSSATVSDIAVGDIISVTYNSKNVAVTAEIITVSAGGTGGSADNGSSANTISDDSTFTGTSYTSTGDDENALRINGATVTLDSITADKSAGSSSNAENGDFYGVNAAILALNGATVTIKNSTVTSSAQNGNGIFSYGSGTTVNVSDTTITTTADNSGGIQTTGGGTTNASNLTVTTSGNSSAAIRSDRGGGTVNVDGGTYTSNGYNSPAVYSTASISVKNANLTANNSEALVIEGKNSISLENCDVSGNMSSTKGSSSDENVHSIMIYQSMSGDAAVGTSEFSMNGGSIKSNNGDMFYITNTSCTVSLSNVSITNADNAYFMNICGNSASHGWGTAGSNGAQVTFTAENQVFSGDIIVDTISTLNMTLKSGTDFSGSVNIVSNAAGGTQVENNAVITVEAGAVWTLTGNCTVSSLTINGTVNFNGYTVTLADGTVLG